MVRGDGPFKVLKRVGDNAYKLQLLGDMAVSSMFNISYLSPDVEDNFEDHSYLKVNTIEEGEALSNQIQTLFSFASLELSIIWGNIFGNDP